ncbi:MAG TPA: serine/threonine-protein kinase [Ktedonosporobacter sp.]|nr:serine/threonine-protein kinase [Ktedonosporobacter sp.]
MNTNPRILGKYELQQCLGRGGMAEVWKAFDPQLRRHVAIKFLHADLRADPDFMIRFIREARVVASLRHPNIVQIHDFQVPTVDANPIAYMVMDYIEGPTLAEYIHNTSHTGHTPPPTTVVELFTAVGSAVDYAHQHGMIHRDIKPANILLDSHNTRRTPIGEPFLTDFGIVKMMGLTPGTLTGAPIGTPLYVSPEQVQGHPGNERSDIYSLGVILYEIYTGIPPFRGDGPYVIMSQHVYSKPTSPRLINQAIPPALETVILRCLQKSPDARFPRASSLVAALAEALKLPIPEEVKHPFYPPDPVDQPTYFQPLDRAPAFPPAPPATGNYAPAQAPSSEATPTRRASVQATDEETTPRRRGQYTPVIESIHARIASAPSAQLSQGLSTVPPTPSLAAQPGHHGGPNVAHLPLSQPAPAPQPAARKRGGNMKISLTAIATLILLAILGSSLLRPTQPSTATQQPPIVGHASFIDSRQNVDPNQPVTDDAFQITLQSIPDPAPGKSYYAWLLPAISQGEGNSIALGKLQVTHGNASLTNNPYLAPQHTNLLLTTSGIRVTEEDANIQPLSPSPDKKTWRYQAEFGQARGPDGYSELDHLRHLLAADPTLDQQGLSGGLDFWFLRNTTEVRKWARDIVDHQHAVDKRSRIVDILYYLHGLCTPQDLSLAAPNTSILPDVPEPATTRVPLLNCAQVPNPESYIQHIIIHLNGVIHSSGSTPNQTKLAAQIIQALSSIEVNLNQLLSDCQKLIQMNDDQLMNSPLLHDVEFQASHTTEGWYDPATQTTHPDTLVTYDQIQALATFDLVPYHGQ